MNTLIVGVSKTLVRPIANYVDGYAYIIYLILGYVKVFLFRSKCEVIYVERYK